MAYNKTSEERKWNYWKEQEEKKLRELGMEEEKIQKLRQMDREDFLAMSRKISADARWRCGRGATGHQQRCFPCW